mmetsp:Transcript_3830/g.11413  ORF Transcript_3830/g.11413 Transcript_3830/m.11413 type:complete len:544 (+) Transcript_3830:200-1831(+)
MSNYSYLEKSGCYWKSAKRTSETFFVSQPGEMSVGLMSAAGVFPMLPAQLQLTLIGDRYDQDFDNGHGTFRSGIVKDRDTDTDLMVLHNVERELLAVVWRGTESFADVRADIAAWSAEWPYATENKKLFVSVGFKNSHESVVVPLTSALKDLWATGRYSRILVAGHSLGGALAHLHAHALSYIMSEELGRSRLPPEERLLCYTIGAPKCGNPEFAMDYARRVPHTYRIVNDADVVPWLPVPRRVHVGVPVLIDETRFFLNPSSQKRQQFSKDVKGISEHIDDHMPPKYLSVMTGHYIRTKLTQRQRDGIDEAWTRLINSRAGVQTILTIEAKDPNAQMDVSAHKFKIMPVSFHEPSQYTMQSALIETFGRDRATPEALELLLLYARKCVETHIFRPWQNEFDDSEVDIHTFRAAVWDLVADPDSGARTHAVEDARLRRVFDKIDANGDGLITPTEFINVSRTVFGPDSHTVEAIEQLGPEAILHDVMREIYTDYNLEYPENLAPTELSFHEFRLWARAKKIDSHSILESVPEEIFKLQSRETT